MESADIIIKKQTMIKKNFNDINQVYTIEKGVSYNFQLKSINEQKLGSGSYGVVHKGTHNVTKQERAIKVIPKSKIKNWERFKTEVKILQTLVIKKYFEELCLTFFIGSPSCYQALRVL